MSNPFSGSTFSELSPNSTRDVSVGKTPPYSDFSLEHCQQRVKWEGEMGNKPNPKSQPCSPDRKLEGDLRIYGSRRYGWRSETSLASRSTVSSGLTEKFSSSSEEDQPVAPNIPRDWKMGRSRGNAANTTSSQSSTFNTLRRPLLKRRAKTLFLRLITETKPHKRYLGWSKRRDSAKALVDILEAEPEGEDIVARRFTKTANRQEAGLRALLQLSDEERCQTAPAPSTLHETSSSCLLKLLLDHSKGRTLFQDSLSNILREETHGIAGLRVLAMEDMQAMSLLDPCLLANFVRRTLQDEQIGSGRWYDAAAFLDVMLRPLWWPSPLTKDLAEVVFDEVTKAFDPQTRHTATSTTRDDHAVRAVALRATYSSCLFAIRENSDPGGRIPSYLPQALFPLISIDSVTGDQGRAMATGLAIISMVLSFPLLAPSGGRGSPFETVDEFADTCIHVMLGSTEWQFRIQEGTDVEGFPKLRPDEDAFDVLCRLPAPTFENALGRLIERAGKHVKAGELTLVSRLLSSLLWLSLRSLHIPQAHRALVGSGVCDFLFEVVKWTVPQETDYQYRDICRVKGDALTCLGNICEAMGAEDLEATLSKDMLNSILSIRDSKTMPTVQIGQAAFTVQRYLAACTRCGVAPRI